MPRESPPVKSAMTPPITGLEFDAKPARKPVPLAGSFVGASTGINATAPISTRDGNGRFPPWRSGRLRIKHSTGTLFHLRRGPERGPRAQASKWFTGATSLRLVQDRAVVRLPPPQRASRLHGSDQAR